MAFKIGTYKKNLFVAKSFFSKLYYMNIDKCFFYHKY